MEGSSGGIMTPEEIAESIVKNADQIYVSESVNGRLGSFALTELPVRLAMQHALRLLLKRVQDLAWPKEKAP